MLMSSMRCSTRRVHALLAGSPVRKLTGRMPRLEVLLLRASACAASFSVISSLRACIILILVCMGEHGGGHSSKPL